MTWASAQLHPKLVQSHMLWQEAPPSLLMVGCYSLLQQCPAQLLLLLLLLGLLLEAAGLSCPQAAAEARVRHPGTGCESGVASPVD